MVTFRFQAYGHGFENPAKRLLRALSLTPRQREKNMERRTFLAAAGVAAASVMIGSKAQADDLALGPLPGTRYPDPRVEAIDKRFHAKIGNAAIEQRHSTRPSIDRWPRSCVLFRLLQIEGCAG